MRDAFKQSTKLTVTKAGSSIRSRGSAFSSTILLRLPPNFLRPSSPIGLLNKFTITKAGSGIGSRNSAFSSGSMLRLSPNFLRPPSPAGLLIPTRRRIVCFELHTPEASNESIETSVGNFFSVSRPRQLSAQIMATPLSPFSSSADTLHENVTPETVDIRKSPDGRPKKIHLKISPNVLDASSVRVRGLNLSSSLNAELPFLPEVGRKTAGMCFTPPPSKRASGEFSNPILQQSVDLELHVLSPNLPRSLFRPDDF